MDKFVVVGGAWAMLLASFVITFASLYTYGKVSAMEPAVIEVPVSVECARGFELIGVEVCFEKGGDI